MSTTIDRLTMLLAKDYELDPATLRPDAALDALGIDSLGVAELMFNIEDEFKVSIPSEPAALQTIGDVVSYIDGLIDTQQTGAVPGTAGSMHPVPDR